MKDDQPLDQFPDQPISEQPFVAETPWDRKDKAMKALMKDTNMAEGEVRDLLNIFIADHPRMTIPAC